MITAFNSSMSAPNALQTALAAGSEDALSDDGNDSAAAEAKGSTVQDSEAAAAGLKLPFTSPSAEVQEMDRWVQQQVS